MALTHRERVVVLDALIAEVDQRQRPVIPVTVDRADQHVLGKDVDLVHPTAHVRVVVAAAVAVAVAAAKHAVEMRVEDVALWQLVVGCTAGLRGMVGLIV